MYTTIIGPPWLRWIVIVDPDRLAGTLICGGGIIGLIGSVASLSLLLGVPSFALVLLLGIYSFRRRKEGRLLAEGGFGSRSWAPSGPSLLDLPFSATASSSPTTILWPKFPSLEWRSRWPARSSSCSPREAESFSGSSGVP